MISLLLEMLTRKLLMTGNKFHSKKLMRSFPLGTLETKVMPHLQEKQNRKNLPRKEKSEVKKLKIED